MDTPRFNSISINTLNAEYPTAQNHLFGIPRIFTDLSSSFVLKYTIPRMANMNMISIFQPTIELPKGLSDSPLCLPYGNLCVIFLSIPIKI